MICTVVLNFPSIFANIANSKAWKALTEEGIDGIIWRGYEFEIPDLPTKVIVSYHPISKYSNRPLLKVYIGSVQKLLLGNNYQNCTDINRIIAKVNEVLRKIPGLEGVDAGEGLVRRVDFCFNYQVGTKVSHYIVAINKADYPSRSKSSFANRRSLPFSSERKPKGGILNGVLFWSKNSSTTFYDKEKECRNPKAFGLIRHEARITGLKAIQSYTGLTDPKLKDLTPEIAERILSNDLKKLRLDKTIISEVGVHQQLIEKHGTLEGKELSSILLTINLHPSLSRKNLAKTLKVGYHTICRWHTTLTNAGVSLVMTDGSTALPPLEVSYDQGVNTSGQKVLGDTKGGDGQSVFDSEFYKNYQPGDILCNFRLNNSKRGRKLWVDERLKKSPPAEPLTAPLKSLSYEIDNPLPNDISPDCRPIVDEQSDKDLA